MISDIKKNNYYNDLSTKFANLGATKIVCAYADVSANSYKNSNDTRITFNSNFKQKPYVCATIEHPWTDTLQCTIDNCSTSGVNVKVYNGSSQNLAHITVHVIAVGYI